MAEPQEPNGGEPQDYGQEPQDLNGEPQEPQEPTGEPGDEPTEPTDDPTVHKLQSWWGRREKALKDEIDQRNEQLMERIEGMLQGAQMQPPQQQYAQQVQQPQMPQIDPYSDDFGNQLAQFLDVRDQQRQQQQFAQSQQAQQHYGAALANMQKILGVDEKTHNAVMKEIVHNENTDPISGAPLGPAGDANLNYTLAYRKVLGEQMASPQPSGNPLEDQPIPKPGLGVSGPSGGTPARTAVPTNLGPKVNALVARLKSEGWDDAKIAEALKKDDE